MNTAKHDISSVETSFELSSSSLFHVLVAVTDIIL